MTISDEKYAEIQQALADKELRTLRAENAQLGHEAADLRFLEASLSQENANLRGENERLEQEVSELKDDVLEHKDACGHLRAALVGRGLDIDAMRAEKAELQVNLRKFSELVTTITGELDWFKRREEKLLTVKAYYGANIDETDVLEAIDALIEWEKRNPKPGAGT